MKNIIVTGDYLNDGLRIEDGSVDLIVTSPPYPGQRNDHRNVDEWMEWFAAVTEIMWHNLKPSGVMVINIMFKRRDGRFDTRLFTHLVPMFEDCGFEMIDMYPFLKACPAPNGAVSGRDRYDTAGWEPVFVLCKPPFDDYTFSIIRRPYKPKSFNSNGTIYSSRKSGGALPNPLGAKQPNYLLLAHTGRDIPRAKGQSFPIQLPEKFILQHTKPGELVLDPFCGVGTTCKAAQKNGRNYIGFEILPDEAATALDWLAENYQTSFVEMEAA